MKNKWIKYVGFSLLALLLISISIPFLFKDKIKALIEQTINDNLDAQVAFDDFSLSLFRNFPRASVQLEGISVINKAPFEGDTLFYAKNVNLKMPLNSLWGDQLQIESFDTENGLIQLKFNEQGVSNLDIALKSTEQDPEQPDEESAPLNLAIQNYSLQNYTLRYIDQGSKMHLELNDLNHQGVGNFAESVLDLDTQTDAKIVFEMDGANFMQNVAVQLDAVLGLDLENSKYSFKENKALINRLPLKFDGFLQLQEAGPYMDFTFATAESGFQNFLALIPEQYAGSIENVKTSGDFTVKGFVKGAMTETTIPQFNIGLKAKDASFQYPDLPKAIRNITIDADIVNATGLMADTQVDLNQLAFAIDQDRFQANANVKNLMENALVDAKLNGTINLANLTKAYPIDLDFPLSGILTAALSTKFDMKQVEESAYDRMQNAGQLGLSNFTYNYQPNVPLKIQKAMLDFNNQRIHLKEFQANMGKSDMNIQGTLANFFGFILKDQKLEGNFNLTSNVLNVGDFLVAESESSTPAQSETAKAEEAKTASTSEPLQIPAFLDCTINANAATVIYDNLQLKNLKGTLAIKDQRASLQKMSTSIFGGEIGFDGFVSTKEAKPKFDMDLSLKSVEINQAFTQLEILSKIAPIANALNGKVNADIQLNGDLDPKEFTPDLKTLSGDLMGQLLSTTVNAKTSPLLTSLDSKLGFIDLSKINLNNLKAHLLFKNGQVEVKPFDIKYQDITLQVGGTHGFNQEINYSLNFDVPAKYLGKEATQLLAKLSQKEIEQLDNVPFKANLKGSFDKPQITTDTKAAITQLTNQIVAKQKTELVEKGKGELNNLIDKAINPNKNNTPTDSTSTTPDKNDAIKDAARDAVKNIFGKKK